MDFKVERIHFRILTVDAGAHTGILRHALGNHEGAYPMHMTARRAIMFTRNEAAKTGINGL
jgi:hypothetical protein